MNVQNKKTLSRGFTLLEVMVVIVILGILASMVVPNLMGSQERANMQKAVSDINALETSLSMYKMDNYDYPTTEQGLEALVQKPSSSPEPKNYQNGGYLKGGKMPVDAWDNEFLYFEDKGKYEIISLGSSINITLYAILNYIVTATDHLTLC